MPHSLTSRPVRGALAVGAVLPSTVQTARLMRSTHFGLSAWVTTTALPRTSPTAIGNIFSP